MNFECGRKTGESHNRELRQSVTAPMGRYTGVKEMVEMSKTPGEYKHPLTPLGSWQPSWL